LENAGFSYSLHSIDLVVIIFYLAASTLVGAMFRKGQKDIHTYFVGDREVSWLLVLISIVATETSTVTFLSVPGMSFNPDGGNLTFLQLALGYMAGRLLIAIVLLPGYFQGQYISAYEVLRKKFDVRVQRSASFLFMLTRTVADGLRLFLTALLLQQFTQWSMPVSILTMGIITVIYTYMGGMQAVLWTDCVQFLIYTLGALIAGGVLISCIPDGWSGFVRDGTAAGKLTLFNLSTDPAATYTLWSGVIGGAFFSMASHGADQIMVQRYLCAKNLTHARAALFVSGFVVLLQFLLFLLIGVGLYLFSKSGAWPLPADIRNDQVFGRFIVEKLPVGLVGLVIASVLAAAMSTLSSSLNSSASAAVADFYKPMRPAKSEIQYLQASRLLTLIFGIGQIGVALCAWQIDSPRSVIDQVLSVAGLTTGMVLGLFLLGVLKQPISSSAALIGMLFGFCVVMAAFIPSAINKPIVAWPWYAPIGTLSTVVMTLVLNAFRTEIRSKEI
jgi:SSS family solute:Na+ symporter